MENENITRVPVTDPQDIPVVDGNGALPEEQNLPSEQEVTDAAIVAAAEADDSEEARVYKENAETPMEAIKRKCNDCSCGQRKERILCPVKGCPLWPLRKGHKPVKRHVSEEFRVAASERFKKMHADKKAAAAAEEKE